MKIGIITIHKIYNFGSSLQAYALAKYINSSSEHNAEIIDYIYPNKYHKIKKNIYKKIRGIGRVAFEIFFKGYLQKKANFKRFINNEIPLSNNTYSSINEINNDYPIYDLYITGSDQVWNPNTLMLDPTYFLFFTPKHSIKIAYSASFAIEKISSEHKETIKKYLSQYKAIGIREKSGISIINEINIPSNIKVCNTCDPTLLLDSSVYENLSYKSTIKIKGKYILIYHLDYAFNPYPALNNVTEQIKQKYNLPIIIIGSYKIKYKGKYKTYNKIGPYEFLYLIKNAELVITSSFHGSIFSIIFRKIFFAITPNSNSTDTRIQDLLKTLNLSEFGIASDAKDILLKDHSPYSEDFENCIKEYIDFSKSFLYSSLQKL